MDLFEELLGDEEGHINYLETQLNLLNEIGIQNYGQLNAHSADEDPRRGRGATNPGRSWADMQLLDGPRLPPAAGGAPRQLVVFLHGYGADGNDLIGLGREWARAVAACRLRLAACAGALRAAPMGRQWFNLTFRDPGELVRGVKPRRRRRSRPFSTPS